MQTDIAAERLRQNPALAECEHELRACVHCGMCTATCPSFAVLGDELDSPRGRIYLIKKMLEADAPADATVARHVDRCLSCLSCMTTCPSGVNYMRLIDHARAHVEATYRRPLADRALRAGLARLLTRPGLFRVALRAGRLTRPLALALIAALARLRPHDTTLPARLRAMLTLLPAQLDAPLPPGTYPARGTQRGRVALLAGCAQSVVAPRITRASVDLLTRQGVEVVLVEGARCCGALPLHMGQPDQARALAAPTIRAWDAEHRARGLDAILTDTSGCGTTLKDYGHLFASHDGAHGVSAELAAATAGKIRDISEYLTELGFTPVRDAGGLRIAYHAACSLQHGQAVRDAPKQLLSRAGFTVLTPRQGHLCCGSAGTYNLLQPEISAELRRRKLATLHALDAAAIAAGNVGCLTQLAGDGLPKLHTVELLAWSAGGEAPPGLLEEGVAGSAT